MPRKKNVPKNQSSLTGIEPPKMKDSKKVNKNEEIFNAPQETKFVKPENPEIAFIQPPDEIIESIPEQKEHFQLPTRFGAVPVDEAPFGWEVETRRHEVKVTKFQHAFPTIRLPFQEVQRVEFGHSEKFAPREREREREQNNLDQLFPTGANRLFFGDNLHVMRQLPSASIDLIYIDPPFFSGRNYNVIFGDKNEVRSFSDIWEGGMPGYLVWLNARLWEMKRLLKSTGSIFVHLDWHAIHYVKVEMDKIFGIQSLQNEIIWHYKRWPTPAREYQKMHDTILCYTKNKGKHIFNRQYGERTEETKKRWKDKRIVASHDQDGNRNPSGNEEVESPGAPLDDVWDISIIAPVANERIGYPTQKPESLLERIIKGSSNDGDVVADFFCGGGTTPAVAQRLNRRWVASDQSRIAVSITADRVAKVVEEKIGSLFPVPDFTVEHWGIYEAPKLEKYSQEKFREFVVRAFGGKPDDLSKSIHGIRQGIPLYVGAPSRKSRITKEDVAQFAKAVYEERHANHGVMLGWNFGPDARQAAEILAARENKRIDFVRLNLVRLEDDEFREHVINQSAEYAPLLSFIQPPEVRVAVRHIEGWTYEFDVSESVSLNKDGIIVNVQWDFDYRDGHFTSTQGYTFLRDKKTGRPILVVQYEFPDQGLQKVACSVQDDQGGEKTVTLDVEVK